MSWRRSQQLNANPLHLPSRGACPRFSDGTCRCGAGALRRVSPQALCEREDTAEGEPGHMVELVSPTSGLTRGTGVTALRRCCCAQERLCTSSRSVSGTRHRASRWMCTRMRSTISAAARPTRLPPLSTARKRSTALSPGDVGEQRREPQGAGARSRRPAAPRRRLSRATGAPHGRQTPARNRVSLPPARQ